MVVGVAHDLPDAGVRAVGMLVEPLVRRHRVGLVDETAAKRE